MSTTVAHRGHTPHIPLAPLIAVLATVAVAAAVIWGINQGTTTSTESATVVAPAEAVAPVSVAAPETQALRRQIAESLALEAAATQTFTFPRNHVQGTTLEPLSTTPFVSAGGSGGYVDPHPFNHFAGSP